MSKSGFTVVHMGKDMQVMIITIALLTQKDVSAIVNLLLPTSIFECVYSFSRFKIIPNHILPKEQICPRVLFPKMRCVKSASKSLGEVVKCRFLDPTPINSCICKGCGTSALETKGKENQVPTSIFYPKACATIS